MDYKGYSLSELPDGKVLILAPSVNALPVVRGNMADAKEFVDIWTMSDEDVHRLLGLGY